MSSIQGVSGAASAAAALRPAAPKAQAVKAETPAQEAMETAAVTKAEASKGDQQAIRKLAQSAPAPKKAEAIQAPRPKGINLTA